MTFRDRLAFSVRQIADPGRGLSSFLSRLSILGLIVAVTILLTVMSVMNGFEREMHDRILKLVPHITQRGFANDDEWRSFRDQYAEMSGITRATVFYEQEALLVRGRDVQAASILGVEQSALSQWMEWAEPGTSSFKQNDVLIGKGLAARLKVAPDSRLRLLFPVQSLGDSSSPRIGVVRVAGVLNTRTELDEGLIIGLIDDVAGLASRGGSVNGVALQLTDLFEAPEMRWSLLQTLPSNFYLTDWTASHGNLYEAIRLSSDLITLLLTTIIAVAVFNVVSSLVLVIMDRRPAIAMLQVVGATRADITWIYTLQGALIGFAGAGIGLVLGAILAASTPWLVQQLEGVVGIQFLNTDVYPLAFLPVDIRCSDVITLWAVSLSLSIGAAAIPAWRANRLSITQALTTARH